MVLGMVWQNTLKSIGNGLTNKNKKRKKMKPLKIRYAKAVCLSTLYIFLVLAVYVGLTKLCGQDLRTDGFCVVLASSAILLHFMEKEDNESKEK